MLCETTLFKLCCWIHLKLRKAKKQPASAQSSWTGVHDWILCLYSKLSPSVPWSDSLRLCYIWGAIVSSDYPALFSKYPTACKCSSFYACESDFNWRTSPNFCPRYTNIMLNIVNIIHCLRYRERNLIFTISCRWFFSRLQDSWTASFVRALI
jgi:hypothetical protein